VASASLAPARAQGLEREWASALANHFDGESGPFFGFAASRVRKRFLGAKVAPAGAGRDGSRAGDDLRTLMDTMTGRLSVQEALQKNRGLYREVQRETPSVPIEQLRPPALTVHPWVELSKALGKPVPDEPLASSTPAEFYFVRARSLSGLLDVLDLVETWGQPAADLLDGRAENRETVARYQTELGLERTALTRALGPELVADLAIVGSDPYVHEGTDLTLLLHAKQTTLLEAALVGVAGAVAAAHGGVTEDHFDHEGVRVTIARSADGRVRQHRATVGDLVIVSNSPGAMRRVLSTIHGGHPRLADEPDFRYMLARDASVGNEVLGYMGDRFVASVVGPSQKILESRRQLALAELSVPGYAALLHGYLNGSSPGTVDELVHTGLLEAGDLAHAGGARIDWQPGGAARSEWGSPAALEPLIDRPPVQRATRSERAGYESFARSYESLWSDKIDPVAVRVTPSTLAGQPGLSVDMRVLPLLRTEYRDLTSTVGDARLTVPHLPSGLRFVLGIGKDASIRRELTQEGRSFAGRQLTFDWIGDYALAGVANRNEFANAVHVMLSDALEAPPSTPRPPQDDDALLANLPVYAAIGVKSRLGAAVVLTALRELAREAAPGAAVWDSAPPYRGNEVVKITVRDGGISVALYYSLLERALVASLNEGALHTAIDQLLDAPPTQAPEQTQEQPSQAVLDIGGDRGSPLYLAALWLTKAKAFDQGYGSAMIAEAVLRGAPDVASEPARARELMKAYFGVVAVTADGHDYVLAPEGVKDPIRGTPNAPSWPELPVPGSASDRVLSRLAHLRTGLSFDTEPGSTPGAPLQSLHARLEIGLR
jgi:hypothetical protein